MTVVTSPNPQLCKSSLKAHHHSIKLMGCHFVITAVSKSPGIAWTAIRKASEEISRIEDLISSWSDNSETATINRQAGLKPVKVSSELWHLIARSQKVSQLTSGAFDISGTLSRDYWQFDGSSNTILCDDKIDELRRLIDYRNIELNRSDQTVYLKLEGMKIGFGGIGKGYAAYRAYKVMKETGIQSGLVNASGDLMFWGNPPGKSDWDINIPDPENHDHSLLQVSVPYGSVVTSGNYEKFALINGKRYSHIVDPRTGRPVTSLKSVSVICPNPELGDALATAISVMGAEDGVALIDQLNGIECLIIDEHNNTFYSKNLVN